MNDICSISAPADAPPSDPPPDRSESCARCQAAAETGLAAEQIVMLRKLAQLGLELAETVQHQAIDRAAREKADGVVRPDLTSAFARAARSARMSMALAAKIDEERRKAGREAAAEREKQARAARIVLKQREKKYLRRIMLQAMATDERLGEKEAARIRGELNERLEDEELYDELGERPIEEIAGHLSRALGIVPDWVRLAAASKRAAAGSGTVDAAGAGTPPPASAGGTLPGGLVPPRAGGAEPETGTAEPARQQAASGSDPP